MRRTIMALGLLLATPSLAWAQQGAAPPRHKSFEDMKANVQKITAPAEKERWQGNVDLWTLLLAEPGPITAETVEKMKAPLAIMKANVDKITVTGEKDRWQANLELWTAYASVTPPGKAVLTAALNRVKTHMEKIAIKAEKERWEANVVLWTETIAKPVS